MPAPVCRLCPAGFLCCCPAGFLCPLEHGGPACTLPLKRNLVAGPLHGPTDTWAALWPLAPERKKRHLFVCVGIHEEVLLTLSPSCFKQVAWATTAVSPSAVRNNQPTKLCGVCAFAASGDASLILQDWITVLHCSRGAAATALPPTNAVDPWPPSVPRFCQSCLSHKSSPPSMEAQSHCGCQTSRHGGAAAVHCSKSMLGHRICAVARAKAGL